ncbi:MAG: hypothetical protein HZB55_07750 [Deltaproteobacteria bacterium]|nr:hypothetical protein [Deltaproteobacteria bacterium]
MRHHQVLIGLALLAGIASPARGFGAEKKNDYAKITLDTGNFNLASRCGQCHVDIYANWKESMHSKALTNATFRATFMDGKIQGNDRLRKLCIQCHAPTSHYDPKLALTSAVAGEGVTCDFCHSIQGLDLRNAVKPFDVVRGQVKRGPFKDTKSPVHETRQTPIFESAELCGGCHEMANVNGVPLITTYSEWRDQYSKKASPSTCQGCHMPLAAGFTVSSKYRKIKRRINLHSFPGGRSRAQLLDALEIKVLEATHDRGKTRVVLGLTNKGTGHSFPTGNPLRKVIVDFSAFSATNKLICREKSILSRTYADKDGKTLTTDLDILLNAVRVSQDSRIPAGSTKQITFEFAAPSEKVLVDVKVSYAYQNEAFPKLDRQEELISFTKVVGKPSKNKSPEEAKAVTEGTPKGSAEIDPSKMVLDAGTFSSASKCGQCHVDIYGMWKDSSHAKALSDPAFQATFRDRQIQSDKRLTNRCLQCHAPTYYYNPKLSLKSGVVTEGVTCDFCHSVQEMDPKSATRPFVVMPGAAKRGPFKDSQSPVHDTRQSPLFEKGDFCGGCHEMANANGLPVITTYSEWKDQYASTAGALACQGCHMPLGAGVTVSTQFQKTKRNINLHEFPGGHSRVQLLDALEIKFLGATRTYGKMKVKLGLTNAGAGHSIPTGNPLRKVIVDFSAYSALNRLVHKEQVVLSKKFADKDGKALSTDLDVLLKAARVVEDNRIPPRATKEIVFEFMAPDEMLLIDAKVIYVYKNDAFPKLARQEKLLSFTTIVNRQQTRRVLKDTKLFPDKTEDKEEK